MKKKEKLTVKKKRIFKGRLLELFTQRTRLINGHTVTLEVIRHPGAALITPFLSKEKILLLKQFRPVINKFIYELPAGTLNRKESPLSCARREIKEETGYSADKFTRLGEIYPVPGYSTERIVIFKAEGLKKVKSSPENDEVISLRVFNRQELREIFRKRLIIDAKTICALSFCGWI